MRRVAIDHVNHRHDTQTSHRSHCNILLSTLKQELIMELTNRNGTRYQLGANQMLKIPRSPRLSITCTGGELCITEAGLTEDVVLKPGATFASHGKGDIVAYASQPSAFDALRAPSLIARCVEFARTLRICFTTPNAFAR